MTIKKKTKSEGDKVNTTVEDLAPKKEVVSPSVVKEEAPEEEEVPEEPKKPERKLDPIRVDVFCRVAMKPDQAAGFLFYAKKNKMPNRTMPEWQEAFEEFSKRPV